MCSDRINKKYIMKIQGRDFVKYEGLLDLWNKEVGGNIETECIQIGNDSNGNTTIFKAIVTNGEGRCCTGHGDANPKNVNRMIAPHSIRMAETRAIARALRVYLAIGMTAVEELGETNGDTIKTTPRKAHKIEPKPPESETDMFFKAAKDDQVEELEKMVDQSSYDRARLKKPLEEFTQGERELFYLSLKKLISEEESNGD